MGLFFPLLSRFKLIVDFFLAPHFALQYFYITGKPPILYKLFPLNGGKKTVGIKLK